jgi:hypothetical protein
MSKIQTIAENINSLISQRDNYRAKTRQRTYKEEAEYSEALRKCKIAILYNNLITLDEFSEHFLALSSSFEELQRASQEIVDFLNENNTSSLEMFVSEETKRIDIKQQKTDSKLILELLDIEKELLKDISKWCQKHFYGELQLPLEN